MRRLSISLLLVLSCTALSAQQQILDAFKPACDSLTLRAREHFRVRSFVRLEKAMRRSGKLDLYFTQNLGDFPWRKEDASWFRTQVETYWPEDLSDYRPGEFFCRSVALGDLLNPEPGNDGRPSSVKFRSPQSGKTVRFIEKVGADVYPKGLSGRYIALWQSHGRRHLHPGLRPSLPHSHAGKGRSLRHDAARA